jgi:hypothetical protein
MAETIIELPDKDRKRGKEMLLAATYNSSAYHVVAFIKYGRLAGVTAQVFS